MARKVIVPTDRIVEDDSGDVVVIGDSTLSGSGTHSAITSKGSLRYCFVLAIEGYDKLLTNHEDPSLVEAGWGDTDWTTAIEGLRVQGDYEQEIEPWKRKMKINEMTFFAMDADGSDTFGKDVFGVASGNESFLDAGIDADDTSMSLKNGTAFASSGALYIGPERMDYTGITDGGDVSGITRGRFHPFSRDSETKNEFGRDHTLASVANDVDILPKVTDVPRVWRGKHVGLWMHRIVGDAIDTKANAQLVFAGYIRDIQDTNSGETKLVCQEMSGRIQATTLFHDQYRGRLKEGIFLLEGWRFYVIELTDGLGTPSNLSDPLVVVASGAGDGEVDQGFYTIDELVGVFQRWLIHEMSNARLDGNWVCFLNPVDDVWRFHIGYVDTGGTLFDMAFYTPPDFAAKLGFPNADSTTLDGNQYDLVRGASVQYSTTGDLSIAIGKEPPIKLDAAQFGANGRIEIEGAQGTLFDNTSHFPNAWSSTTNDTGTWAVLMIGDSVMTLCKELSTDLFSFVTVPGLQEQFGGSIEEDVPAIRVGEEGELDVKQVAILSGTFKDVMMRLLLSTGASGYNHATYDDYAYHLGAAIPFELMSEMEDALDDLDAETETEASMTVVLEKPTRLTAILLPELILRSAWLVWDSTNESYTLAPFQSPVAATAVHTFDSSTKASAEPDDAMRAVPTRTDQWLVNVLKIAYNRNAFEGERYRSTLTVKHTGSISDFGESKPFTVKARNSYGQYASSGQAVEDLAAGMISKMMPIFAEPVLIMKSVPISPKHYFGVKPGDLGTLTDDFIRDPSTGQRGISGKPCMVMAHRYGLGGSGGDMWGEVDLVIADFDNVVLYVPSAHIDDDATGGGYEADTDIGGNSSPGTSRIKLREHEYTDTTGALADWTYFDAGDIVDIIEIDPTSASPQRWNGVAINQPSALSYFELDQNLSGFDSSKLYRVVYANYTAVTASQRSHAFTADDADYQIEDSRSPYEFGQEQGGTWTADASTELPERFPTGIDTFGDGEPLATAYHQAGVRLCNNLIDYKLAVQSPFIVTDAATHAGADYEGVLFTPYFFGPGTGVDRDFSIAVLASIGSAGSGWYRITLSFLPPTGADGTYTFRSPYVQAEFEITSTTKSIATAQTIKQTGNSLAGVGYLSIESKGPQTPTLYGIAEMVQQPR